MSRILLVEDNEMNRDMLTRRLIRRGFEVIVALDGEEAIFLTHKQKPDLILMDLGLPKVDGLEATKVIKSNDATKHIPIIVLSAHALLNDRKKALQAGADDYDSKPVEFPRLLSKIATFIGENSQ